MRVAQRRGEQIVNVGGKIMKAGLGAHEAVDVNQ